MTQPSLHKLCNIGIMTGMSASTVGFSITDSYRPRLERLVERRADGNRSAFLREAIDVMERYDRAQTLSAIQEYGSIRFQEMYPDIPIDQVVVELQSGELRDHAPQVREDAHTIVAGLEATAKKPEPGKVQDLHLADLLSEIIASIHQ